MFPRNSSRESWNLVARTKETAIFFFVEAEGLASWTGAQGTVGDMKISRKRYMV
jgi:hypothetical protein